MLSPDEYEFCPRKFFREAAKKEVDPLDKRSTYSHRICVQACCFVRDTHAHTDRCAQMHTHAHTGRHTGTYTKTHA